MKNGCKGILRGIHLSAQCLSMYIENVTNCEDIQKKGCMFVFLSLCIVTC